MDSMSVPALADEICETLAILLPVIFMLRLERREVLFGTVAVGFFLSIPPMVFIMLDPVRRADDFYRGQPQVGIALNLIMGLTYSVMLWLLRAGFQNGAPSSGGYWRSVGDWRKARTSCRSPAPSPPLAELGRTGSGAQPEVVHGSVRDAGRIDEREGPSGR